jgi:hypothetical protein
MRLMLICGAGALLMAGPAAAENWNSVTRTTNNAFMVDVDAIAAVDGITSAPVATVPRNGDAGDYSHSVETYQFRCAARQWRTAGLVDYASDGTEADRVPEDGASWEPVRANTLPDFLKQIVCDGSRSQAGAWPTLKAFVDGGRILPDA